MDETGKKWHSEAFSLLSIILKRMYTFHMCVLHYKSYKETLQKQNISVLFCVLLLFSQVKFLYMTSSMSGASTRAHTYRTKGTKKHNRKSNKIQVHTH